MKHLQMALRAGPGALLLALATTTAIGLVASDGYVATHVFSLSDTQAEVTYDAGFDGVRWQDMDPFSMGPLTRSFALGEEAGLAVNGQGEIFALVYGYFGNDYYTGVIAYDGSDYRHLAQDELLDVGIPWLYRAGGNMRALTVSPVTAGRLVEGHPLVVRTVREVALYNPGGDSGATHLEILSIDPTMGSRTLVHSWECSVGGGARLAVDASGAIYVLQDGILDASGSRTSATILRLRWNGAGYDEATFFDGAEGGVLLGPGGDLFTFAENNGMGWDRQDGSKPEILRIDPDTGTASTFAHVDGRVYIHDWAFDTDGVLWIALDGGRKKSISRVPPGGTATASKEVGASWSGHFTNVVAGESARLYVAEGIYESDAEVSTLDPSTDGGSGGGGGGGKGGGKGKPN